MSIFKKTCNHYYQIESTGETTTSHIKIFVCKCAHCGKVETFFEPKGKKFTKEEKKRWNLK